MSALTCQICGYFVTNRYLKLLLREAFFSVQNAPHTVWRPGYAGSAGKEYGTGMEKGEGIMGGEKDM